MAWHGVARLRSGCILDWPDGNNKVANYFPVPRAPGPPGQRWAAASARHSAFRPRLRPRLHPRGRAERRRQRQSTRCPGAATQRRLAERFAVQCGAAVKAQRGSARPRPKPRTGRVRPARAARAARAAKAARAPKLPRAILAKIKQVGITPGWDVSIHGQVGQPGRAGRGRAGLAGRGVRGRGAHGAARPLARGMGIGGIGWARSAKREPPRYPAALSFFLSDSF